MADTIDIEKERRKRNSESQSNRSWTPKECLEKTIRDIEDGEITHKSILVIAFDKEVVPPNGKGPGSERYRYAWRTANMGGADLVLLLEMMKIDIIRDL